MHSRSYWLRVATAVASSRVGRAGDVGRTCNRTNLTKQVSVLCLLAQLEVSGQQLSVAVLELVAESLNSVGVDECASSFALGMDCGGDVASVLRALKADSVDVAIDAAAAILHCVAKVTNALTGCVEAVTNAIGDAAQLSVYVLVVEAFEEIGTSEGTLDCGVASTITTENTTAAENCEPNEVNEPDVTE